MNTNKLNEISKIVDQLEAHGAIPFLKDDRFIRFQNIVLGPEIREMVYDNYFRLFEEKFQNQKPDVQTLELETLKWAFLFSLDNEILGDLFVKMEVNMSAASKSKIAYNFLLYFFSICRVGNFNRLVFLLREVDFEEKFITNIKEFHTRTNYLKRFCEPFDFIYDCMLEGQKEKQDFEAIAYKYLAHGVSFIDSYFSPVSTEIQFDILPHIEYNNLSIEGMILASDWQALNQYYAPIVNTIKASSNVDKTKDEVLELIRKGCLPEVFEYLKKYKAIEEDITILSFRWNTLPHDILKFGSFEDKSTEMNRIAGALTQLCNRL